METDIEQELFFPTFFSLCFRRWEKVKLQMKARAPRSKCFSESRTGSSLLTPLFTFKLRDMEIGTEKASVHIWEVSSEF